jgi:hypothetical protein
MLNRKMPVASVLSGRQSRGHVGTGLPAAYSFVTADPVIEGVWRRVGDGKRGFDKPLFREVPAGLHEDLRQEAGFSCIELYPR